MFTTLIFLHSVIRWFVLATLMYSIIKAFQGYANKLPFTKSVNSFRHWTATTAHLQLIVGLILYTKSYTVKSLTAGAASVDKISEPVFFGIIHTALMLCAIVVITIGSAVTKRKPTDHEKYKTMLLWFAIALLIIFFAIPWPFSLLIQRPYLRSL